MESMNFTDEFSESLAALSMQYYNVFEKPTDELVKEYICNLENGKVIYEFIKSHKKELFHYRFDERLFNKKYPFNSPVYSFNKAVYLFSTFIFLYVFNKGLEHEDFYDLSNLQEMQFQAIIINSLISSLIMQFDLSEFHKLDFNSSYSPNTSIVDYINNIYKTEYFLKILCKSFNLDEELRNLNQEIDKGIIETEYIFMKIQSVLLLMESSDLYSKHIQKISKSIISIFKEVLFNVRIMKIDIDESLFFGVIRQGYRKTTCIKIFFALENLDRYCLRIDFPHEGVEFLHYNLHEYGRTTGLPLNKSQYRQLIKKFGNLDNIFFYFNNMYWFKNDFKSKLDQLYPGDDKLLFRKEMLELFRYHSHYQLIDEEISTNDMFDFISAFGIALSHMSLNEFSYCDTSNDDIDKELIIIKCKDILHVALAQYQTISIYEQINECSYEMLKNDLKEKVLNSLINCYKNIEYDFAPYEELNTLNLKDIFLLFEEYFSSI